ncbi:hypothetical protein SAMN05660461_5520 [Chitinophaga ginsengisegetis]|uniref:Uncharacterized protein n=1 Tax=Chitinophaga ginsengisegetis TaxID=393003 RepID=A0A1T5PA92_9BACT|nr:hypothetical protein [Chitinophaga ginsengisegetis]SKD09631.1 hypothetical protein SAMN05660461_5520 [Chitinophaga ginsengisegetis]
MKDITHSIEKAISQDVLWRQGFSNIIKKLENNGYIISFWENEENWASILLGDEIIGYMWEKYPLVFIKSQHSDSIKSLLSEGQPIVFIDANEMTEKVFIINYEALKDYIDYGLPDDGFSAEDFWFVTNT